MPPRARRESGTDAPAAKRRRTSKVDKPDDDPFRSSSPVDDSFIDLTADDGKADLERMKEERQQEKEENGDIIKLSAFQCVICMDDATNLTVTHCGTFWPTSLLPRSISEERQTY